MKAVTEDNVIVIEAPRRTDLVTQLVKRLKPKIVVTGIAAFELQTSTAFEQLLEVSAEVGARLFVDISDHVELSSLPGTNGVLQYMASHALPIHAAIICGLLKNQVFGLPYTDHREGTLLSAFLEQCYKPGRGGLVLRRS